MKSQLKEAHECYLNGLELPQDPNAAEVGAKVGVVADVEAARGEAPNSQLTVPNLLLAACVCPRVIIVESLLCFYKFGKDACYCIYEVENLIFSLTFLVYGFDKGLLSRSLFPFYLDKLGKGLRGPPSSLLVWGQLRPLFRIHALPTPTPQRLLQVRVRV